MAAIALLLVLPSPWSWAAFAVCLLVFPVEVALWNRTVRNRREAVGASTLIGTEAIVVTPCFPDGQVRVGGERWAARCVGGAGAGDTVRVVGLDGITLVVERSPG